MAYDEDTIAELLRELPEAPEGWVAAAQELPAARAALDGIAARAEADAAFRAETLAGLERALEQAGQVPDPQLVAILRARLDQAGA